MHAHLLSTHLMRLHLMPVHGTLADVSDVAEQDGPARDLRHPHRRRPRALPRSEGDAPRGAQRDPALTLCQPTGPSAAVTWTCCCAPDAPDTVSVSRSPGWWVSITFVSVVAESIGFPSMAVIMSPAARPACCAGPRLTTSRTLAPPWPSDTETPMNAVLPMW